MKNNIEAILNGYNAVPHSRLEAILTGRELTPVTKTEEGLMELVKGGETVEVTVIAKAPVFKGVGNISVIKNTSFVPLEGVTVSDEMGNDLTSAMQVTGSISMSNANSQKLTYTVTDSRGVQGFKHRWITVVEPEEEIEEETE